jgi:hypothetical protein
MPRHIKNLNAIFIKEINEPFYVFIKNLVSKILEAPFPSGKRGFI